MTVSSARWGVPQVVVSVALLAGIVVAAALARTPSALVTGIVLPSAALALGVLALFAGHVSYPRVQNLRVYLAGYSVGLQSIALALFVGFSGSYERFVPPIPAGYDELVFAVALLLCFAFTLLPPFPPYRTTRIVTAALLGLQAALFAAVRFVPAGFERLAVLVPDRPASPAAIVAAALLAGVVAVNALMRPQSFYLRGTFSGLAVLAGGAWLVGPVLNAFGVAPPADGLVTLAYATVAPLFLIGSIIAHVLARMTHRASYDPLLQVYNREYCNNVVAELSSVPTRPPLAVLMIDIDRFKQVNDTYGHEAGDRVLFAVAQAVQKSVVPEGIVCRYGGEELVVFVPGRSGRDAVPLAQRIRANVEALETGVRGKRIGVTVSIGMSERPSARVPIAHVVRAADRALYVAKENGRNQVRFVRIREPAGGRSRGAP